MSQTDQHQPTQAPAPASRYPETIRAVFSAFAHHGRPLRGLMSPVSARARARARVEAGNQRPWPADKVERWAIVCATPDHTRRHTAGR